MFLVIYGVAFSIVGRGNPFCGAVFFTLQILMELGMRCVQALDIFSLGITVLEITFVLVNAAVSPNCKFASRRPVLHARRLTCPLLCVNLRQRHELPREGQAWRLLRKGKLPPCPRHYSPKLATFIVCLMHPDSSRRFVHVSCSLLWLAVLGNIYFELTVGRWAS